MSRLLIIVTLVVLTAGVAGWITREGGRIAVGVLGFWGLTLWIAGDRPWVHVDWFALTAGPGVAAAFGAAWLARWLDTGREQERGPP